MAIWRFKSGVIAQSHDGFTTKYRQHRLRSPWQRRVADRRDVMTQKPIGTVVLRTAKGEEELSFDRDDLYTRSLRQFHAAIRGEGAAFCDRRGRGLVAGRRRSGVTVGKDGQGGRYRSEAWERRVSKVVTAAEAASLIKDGMVVSVSSSSGLGCPDLMLKAIGERFDCGRPSARPDHTAPDRRRRHERHQGRRLHRQKGPAEEDHRRLLSIRPFDRPNRP